MELHIWGRGCIPPIFLYLHHYMAVTFKCLPRQFTLEGRAAGGHYTDSLGPDVGLSGRFVG
jgi:hypothetical protein